MSQMEAAQAAFLTLRLRVHLANAVRVSALWVQISHSLEHCWFDALLLAAGCLTDSSFCNFL